MFPRILSLSGILFTITSHAADTPTPFLETEVAKFKAQATKIETISLPAVRKDALKCDTLKDQIASKLDPEIAKAKGVLVASKAAMENILKEVGSCAEAAPEKSNEIVNAASTKVHEMGKSLNEIKAALKAPETLTQLRWAITCGSPMNPIAQKVVDRAFEEYEKLIAIQGGIETYLTAHKISIINQLKAKDGGAKTCSFALGMN